MAVMAREGMATTARVRYEPVSGGCWILVTPDGRRYEPVNLGIAYRVRGMSVTVTLRPADRTNSICQVGPLVRIVSIASS